MKNRFESSFCPSEGGNRAVMGISVIHNKQYRYVLT